MENHLLYLLFVKGNNFYDTSFCLIFQSLPTTVTTSQESCEISRDIEDRVMDRGHQYITYFHVLFVYSSMFIPNHLPGDTDSTQKGK